LAPLRERVRERENLGSFEKREIYRDREMLCFERERDASLF